MQFFIDGNQIDGDNFVAQLGLNKSALNNVQQVPDIELHLDTKQLYFLLEKRQKIEINIPASLDYHKKFFYKNSAYDQPLFRALGLKKGKLKPKVLDCTGGMLGDSLLIYSILNQISVCERNPLIAFLIQLNLKLNPLEDFKFYPQSFNECLKELTLSEIDTFYYDPMYAQKNSKSAPKKEMLFFREHIGVDLDREEMIQLLIDTGKRVVVKRSQKAAAFLKPAMSYGKKSTIYDVYI